MELGVVFADLQRTQEKGNALFEACLVPVSNISASRRLNQSLLCPQAKSDLGLHHIGRYAAEIHSSNGTQKPGIIRVQGEGLAVVTLGFIRLSELEQQKREILQSFSVGWIQLQSRLVFLNGQATSSIVRARLGVRKTHHIGYLADCEMCLDHSRGEDYGFLRVLKSSAKIAFFTRRRGDGQLRFGVRNVDLC